MSRESAFIDLLRAIALDPAARGLTDDCAVLPMGDRDLVLNHDMIVEGIHFLPDDPPEDIAWKLVAVNLSDLAAKGARPLGVLLGYPLGRDELWDARFVSGLGEVLDHFNTPLLGGDTVWTRGPRSFGLTAIGEVRPDSTPARDGAQAGDGLWVTGLIGAAGVGLAVALGQRTADAGLLNLYRRPVPRLAEGRSLAPLVTAMTDISDGLLIDAARMAKASGLGVTIELDTVPFHPEVKNLLTGATSGDDYELIFAASIDFRPPEIGLVTRIGSFSIGSGLRLTEFGKAIPAPASLGYEHDSAG